MSGPIRCYRCGGRFVCPGGVPGPVYCPHCKATCPVPTRTLPQRIRRVPFNWQALKIFLAWSLAVLLPIAFYFLWPFLLLWVKEYEYYQGGYQAGLKGFELKLPEGTTELKNAYKRGWEAATKAAGRDQQKP
jgi:hypothetical protein